MNGEEQTNTEAGRFAWPRMPPRDETSQSFG